MELFQDTRRRLEATRTDAQARRAAQPQMAARRRLFEAILALNGHDPDAATFPQCGVSLGGRLAWLTPPDAGWNLLNAELTVN